MKDLSWSFCDIVGEVSRFGLRIGHVGFFLTLSCTRSGLGEGLMGCMEAILIFAVVGNVSTDRGIIFCYNGELV